MKTNDTITPESCIKAIRALAINTTTETSINFHLDLLEGEHTGLYNQINELRAFVNAFDKYEDTGPHFDDVLYDELKTARSRLNEHVYSKVDGNEELCKYNNFENVLERISEISSVVYNKKLSESELRNRLISIHNTVENALVPEYTKSIQELKRELKELVDKHK